MRVPPEAPRPSPRALTLLLVATAVVFGPSTLGDFVWDDKVLILDNRHVRAPEGLVALLTASFTDTSSGDSARATSYWRPLIAAVWAVEWRAFGASPRGWHLVNLALHLACVALAAGWLLRRVADGRDERQARVGALLGAALFALHPTRPESVTWISGGTDLWATLFILLALRLWERATTAGDALVGGLLALALASKESALAAPVALAVDHALRAGSLRAVPWKRLALASGPMAALFALRLTLVPLPRSARAVEALDLVLRVLSSLGHAARFVVAPYPPAVFAAPATFAPGGRPTYVPWSVALGLVVAVGVAAVFARARRDPAWRPWSADLAWLVVPLSPALNLVPLGLMYLFAMRFLYLPMLGAAALVARAVASLEGRSFRAGALATGGVVLVAAFVSLDHVGDLASDEALWTRERELRPELCFTHAELAVVRANQRRYDDALALEVEHFRCAARARDALRAGRAAHAVAERLAAATPDADQQTLREVAAFLRQFDPDSAGGAALRAGGETISARLDARVRRAEWPEVEPFLAAVEARTLDYASAEERLRRSLRARPRDPVAWRNLAALLATRERWPEAVEACDRGLAVLPSSASMRALRAMSARALRDGPPADPYVAALARGDRLVELGAREEARRLAATLTAAHPDRVEPTLLRARVELADGLPAVAQRVLREALTTLPAGARPRVERMLREVEGR